MHTTTINEHAVIESQADIIAELRRELADAKQHIARLEAAKTAWAKKAEAGRLVPRLQRRIRCALEELLEISDPTGDGVLGDYTQPLAEYNLPTTLARRDRECVLAAISWLKGDTE